MHRLNTTIVISLLIVSNNLFGQNGVRIDLAAAEAAVAAANAAVAAGSPATPLVNQPLSIDYDNEEIYWQADALIELTKGTDISSHTKYTVRNVKTKTVVKSISSTKRRILFDLVLDFDNSDFQDDLNDLSYEVLDPNNVKIADVVFSFNDQSTNPGLKSRPLTVSLEEFINENYPDLKYNRRRNILTDGNTIHIFIDQDGNFVKSGLPTTAKEENTYQFHVLFWDDLDFRLTSNGVFKPATLNIQNTSEANSLSGVTTEVKEKKFGVIGPFTDKFDVEIKKIGDRDPILKSNVPIAKLYHVSISTGLFKTTLKNPQNVEISNRVENGLLTGDSTLIADDPGMRGVITVMATYYPRGRSFLFPPRGGAFDPSRIGILVGAQLDDDLSENFFLGISSDFARGGAFAIGIHCGRRNYIAGNQYDDFDFGTQQFTGELNVKREWDLGIFFGAVIDTRIAGQLFKRLSDDN